MKRLLVSSTIAALVAGGAGFAFAAPGPNGHNNYGLCQAYFSGSATGQSHKQSAPPFAALAAAAQSQNETVAQFCQNVTPGGK